MNVLVRPFGNDDENKMRADDIANHVRSDRDALRPDQPPGTETVFNGRQTLTFDYLQLTVLTELLPGEDPTTAEESIKASVATVLADLSLAGTAMGRFRFPTSLVDTFHLNFEDRDDNFGFAGASVATVNRGHIAGAQQVREVDADSASSPPA